MNPNLRRLGIAGFDLFQYGKDCHPPIIGWDENGHRYDSCQPPAPNPADWFDETSENGPSEGRSRQQPRSKRGKRRIPRSLNIADTAKCGQLHLPQHSGQLVAEASSNAISTEIKLLQCTRCHVGTE